MLDSSETINFLDSKRILKLDTDLYCKKQIVTQNPSIGLSPKKVLLNDEILNKQWEEL